MRTLPLIAFILFAVAVNACGVAETGPDPAPDPAPAPTPDPYAADDGAVAPPADAGAVPAPDTGPTTPAPNKSCAPAGQYSGAATGSIDATIPLLGKQTMPVECQVKFTVQGSGSAAKAAGTVQVIDPKTKKPWSYAPKPFTFQANVACDKMTGPLTGNINALGLQVAFSGSIEGSWDGASFKGTWKGGAVSGVTAAGGGAWSAKP